MMIIPRHQLKPTICWKITEIITIHKKRSAAQGGLDQVAFITDGKRKKLDRSLCKYPYNKCCKCGEFGHCKENPKNQENTSTGQTEIAMTTLQVTLTVTKTEINSMRILCDNESTIDIFKKTRTSLQTFESRIGSYIKKELKETPLKLRIWTSLL